MILYMSFCSVISLFAHKNNKKERTYHHILLFFTKIKSDVRKNFVYLASNLEIPLS